MEFASKQCKSRHDSIHCKFVTWIQIWFTEQFIIDQHAKSTPEDKSFRYVEQDCFSCEPTLFHMTINKSNVEHEHFCSTDNVRGVRDKYDNPFTRHKFLASNIC